MAEKDTSAQNVPPGVNPWLIAMAVILPAFMEVIDTSIASVCIPYIAGSLSASYDEATYVLTFYLLSNAVILPASAWFSLRFGRKRFLISSIVIFTIASFFCGAATNLIMILIARLIQGAGGGALQPLSQAIITESFPPEKRGMAMGMFGLGVVVAPVLGPTLGGWLTDAFSWRWAFYINIPIGVLAIVLITRFVKDPPYIVNAKPGKLDSIGFGLLAIGLGCMQIILDRGQQDDWFGATWVRYAFVAMIVCLSAFIVSQLCDAAEQLAKRSPGGRLAMPLVGLLVAKVDTRILVSTGFMIFACCSLVWGTITLQVSPWSLTWPIIISGFSLGLVFVPLSVVTLGGLKPQSVGNGSGLYNLMRNIGGSIGISVAQTILARHEQLHRTELSHDLAPTLPRVQQGLSQFQNMFSAAANQATAHTQPLGQVERILNRQAQLWSYVDDFRYMALACFLCVPLVWTLKKVKARGAPVGAH